MSLLELIFLHIAPASSPSKNTIKPLKRLFILGTLVWMILVESQHKDDNKTVYRSRIQVIKKNKNFTFTDATAIISSKLRHRAGNGDKEVRNATLYIIFNSLCILKEWKLVWDLNSGKNFFTPLHFQCLSSVQQTANVKNTMELDVFLAFVFRFLLLFVCGAAGGWRRDHRWSSQFLCFGLFDFVLNGFDVQLPFWSCNTNRWLISHPRKSILSSLTCVFYLPLTVFFINGFSLGGMKALFRSSCFLVSASVCLTWGRKKVAKKVTSAILQKDGNSCVFVLFLLSPTFNENMFSVGTKH